MHEHLIGYRQALQASRIGRDSSHLYNVSTAFECSINVLFPQKLKPATEEALEQLSNSIYRTSVYQDTMKKPKHSRVQIVEGPGNRAVRFREEDISPNGLETWEISDQEDIERNESSEDEDETEVNKFIFQNGAETSKELTFYQKNEYKSMFKSFVTYGSSLATVFYCRMSYYL